MNNFLNKIISTLRRNSLLLNIEHVKIHFVCNLCDARDAFHLTGLSVCRNHIPILSSLITEFVSSRVQCSIKDCFGAMWKWFCSESCSFWTVYYNVLLIFRFFFTMFSSIKHIKYCKEKMKNIKYNNLGTYFKNKSRKNSQHRYP
jgi:hypothetical protein